MPEQGVEVALLTIWNLQPAVLGIFDRTKCADPGNRVERSAEVLEYKPYTWLTLVELGTRNVWIKGVVVHASTSLIFRRLAMSHSPPW